MKWLALLFFLLPWQSIAQDKPYLDIQEVVSQGGIKAWLVEDHSNPIISVKFAFKNGSALDAEEQQGLTQLLSNTLDEGAGPYPSVEFQKRLNDRSITLNFSASRDAFFGNLKTLSKHKEEAFALLKLALTKPLFDEEPVTRMVNSNISRIKSSLTDPSWIASRIKLDKAYEGHPYSQNSGGTISSLQKLTPADLKKAWAEHINKDNLIISVTGDLTAKELSAILDIVFGTLPEKTAQETLVDITLQNTGKTFSYSHDSAQSFIQILYPGIKRQDPNYYTALVLNHIFGGGGFGSMLMEEIREKRGLTYGIYSHFSHLKHSPTLEISTSTDHTNTQEILDIVKQLTEKLKNTPVSKKQLQAAKDYLIGSLPLTLTSTDKIAAVLLHLQLEKLSKDTLDQRAAKINAITAEQIQGMAQRIFKEEPLTLLLGTPILDEETTTEVIQELPNVY